jgi:hypothetical protein
MFAIMRIQLICRCKMLSKIGEIIDCIRKGIKYLVVWGGGGENEAI